MKPPAPVTNTRAEVPNLLSLFQLALQIVSVPILYASASATILKFVHELDRPFEQQNDLVSRFAGAPLLCHLRHSRLTQIEHPGNTKLTNPDF